MFMKRDTRTVFDEGQRVENQSKSLAGRATGVHLAARTGPNNAGFL
jgi:hypothetical protein